MIEVWGRATSSNVQAVMWCAAELGLEVVRHDRGHRHGGLDTPEYRAMNPHGLVPVIREDGGPAIWESGAIVRYLAARHGDAAFWPPDPAERAALDMWAEWIKTALGPAFTLRIFWPRLRPPEGGLHPETDATAVAEITELARRLDLRLGAGPWLAGETFTWADIVVGHLTHRWFTLDWPRPDLPHLADYRDRLVRRPAYAEHVMVDWSVLRTPA